MNFRQLDVSRQVAYTSPWVSRDASRWRAGEPALASTKESSDVPHLPISVV